MIQLLVKKLIPVIGLFLLINLIVFMFGASLKEEGFNVGFLTVANALLFILTLLGFYLQTRGVRSSNVNAFIRGVYGSLLLKMFVISGAIVLYIAVMGGAANRPSIFASMAIYLVYTALEVIQLMKIARKKPDA